jgi:hypothetical protein
MYRLILLSSSVILKNIKQIEWFDSNCSKKKIKMKLLNTLSAFTKILNVKAKRIKIIALINC